MTAPTPGTKILVNKTRLHIPEMESQERLVLDPALYCRDSATAPPMTGLGESVLIHHTDGWGGWTAPAHPQPGQSVGLWWVGPDDYEVADPDERRSRVVASNDEARKAVNAYEALKAEYVGFKERVRQLAISTADDEGWCLEGLDDALRSLGLKPRDPEWVVDVFVSRPIRFHVRADTEVEAVDIAKSRAVDARNWTGEWAVEVKDIKEADSATC